MTMSDTNLTQGPASGGAAAAGPAGLLFRAPPDNGKILVRFDDKGRPFYQWPNQLVLPLALQERLERDTPVGWHARNHARTWPDAAWIINSCTDPDSYRQSLIWLDEEQDPKVPILNHPRAVAASRRDHSARRLAGIPGLTVPRYHRFVLNRTDAPELAFAEAGFDYPVLVRPSALQSGVGMVKVTGPKDWPRVLQSNWYGTPHFMFSFHDFANAAGEYVKARIAFVGDRFFVRHVKAAQSWNVHDSSPDRVDGFEARELDVVDALNADPELAAILSQFADRTRLDLYGLDLGVDLERRQFVMFECNPSMTLFFFQNNVPLTPEREARRKKLQLPIEEAIIALMEHPARWAAARPGFHADMPSCRSLLAD
jgi:hypothetical protein